MTGALFGVDRRFRKRGRPVGLKKSDIRCCVCHCDRYHPTRQTIRRHTKEEH